MTKVQYLEELRKELKSNGVNGIDEILCDYEEHFDFKSEEGYTEEEIAAKLSAPSVLAKEYARDTEKGNRHGAVKVAGIGVLSAFLAFVYALMWCAVVALAAFSLLCVVTGFCLITTVNVAGLIPQMPYLSALFVGIACFGLALLSALGTFHTCLYLLQWGKAYSRWGKSVMNDRTYPAISMHPKLPKKVSYRLKLAAMIGLIVFAAAFVVGFASMCIYAGSIEPWHVWKWFQS